MMSKDYTVCGRCGERFVIDEVDFCFNQKYDLSDICPNCSKKGLMKRNERRNR